MAESIIDGTIFNTNDIKYTAPKATAQGAKSVNILNKSTKRGLVLSTPLMLTWGASDFIDEKTGQSDGKFSMSLQFPSEEYQTEDTSSFLKNMKALEDKIKTDALIYSKEWFGKVHKSLEVVEALWTPMLKYSKDKVTGEYDYSKPPTIKIKIQQWDNVWKTEIYDEDGERLFPSSVNNLTPLDYLKRGSNVMCLIQFAGIWFVNGKFSASWKLVQAVVQKPKATLQGQCFLNIKPKDKEILKTQTVVDEEVDFVTTTNVNVLVEDDDVYHEELVLDKPVVEEATVVEAVVEAAAVEEPKKKKIVKKKVAGDV